LPSSNSDVKSQTIFRQTASIDGYLFTWRTVPPNLIPIRFEMMDHGALHIFEERRPNMQRQEADSYSA